jgi:transcriptional regulator with XRE-family HTH domain
MKTDIKTKVGKIIQLLRVAEGLSQSKLAEELEISRAYLSQVENGHNEPGLGLLKKVAKYFEIPLAVILPDAHVEDSELFEDMQKLLAQILTIKVLAKKA